jgi:hypothetical protein
MFEEEICLTINVYGSSIRGETGKPSGGDLWLKTEKRSAATAFVIVKLVRETNTVVSIAKTRTRPV